MGMKLKTGILLMAFSLAARAYACPGCKEAVAGAGEGSGPDPSALANGYGWSIIFMLAAVFSLIAFAVYQVHGIISAEEAKVRAQQQAPLAEPHA